MARNPTTKANFAGGSPRRSWFCHSPFDKLRANGLPGCRTMAVAPKTETRYIPPMHFSRHISQLHSTFSLLAALKLRPAR
jgi:hypothetical protein